MNVFYDHEEEARYTAGGEVEVRQVFELEDFGESEAIELHAKHREILSKK